MKTQIIKNVASNYLSSGIGVILGFWLVPFLVAKLGKEAFGLSVLAESIILFFQMFVFSIRIALARYATVAFSRKDMSTFAEYLGTGRVLLYILTLLILIPGTIVSFYFHRIFTVPAVYAHDSRLLFFLITVAFSISIPNVVYWSVLYARQRFDLLNLAMSGGFILRALAIFVLFSFFPQRFANLASYGIIYLVMTWTQNYAVYLFQKKLIPGLKIRLADFRQERCREILSYSGNSILGEMGLIMAENVMNVLINLFWGPLSNAVYSVALKIPVVLRKFFLESAWSLTPTFTDLVARDEHERLQRLYTMFTKALSIVVMPIYISLIFMSGPVMFSWVGHDFLRSAELMPIYLVIAIMSIPASVAAGVTIGFAKVRLPSRVSFFSALLCVVLAVVLGKYLSLGLFGIALAALVATVLDSFLFYPYYACRIAGMDFRKFALESYFKPLIFSAAIVSIVMGLRLVSGFHLSSLKAIGLVMAILCLIDYAAAYKFLLSPEERSEFRLLAVFISKKKNPGGTSPEEAPAGG